MPAFSPYQALKKMFKILWGRMAKQSKYRRNALRAQIHTIDKRVDSLLNRVAEESNEKVVDVCLKKIGDLESQKVILEEKAERTGGKNQPFSKLYELACSFIENPLKLWDTGQLEHKHAVLKLVFSAPPQYTRNQGFTNPNLSLPFKALSGLNGQLGQDGGEGGIRTPGTVKPNGFQDRRIRPLCHLSICRCVITYMPL